MSVGKFYFILHEIRIQNTMKKKTEHTKHDAIMDTNCICHHIIQYTFVAVILCSLLHHRLFTTFNKKNPLFLPSISEMKCVASISLILFESYAST